MTRCGRGRGQGRPRNARGRTSQGSSLHSKDGELHWKDGELHWIESDLGPLTSTATSTLSPWPVRSCSSSLKAPKRRSSNAWHRPPCWHRPIGISRPTRAGPGAWAWVGACARPGVRGSAHTRPGVRVPAHVRGPVCAARCARAGVRGPVHAWLGGLGGVCHSPLRWLIHADNQHRGTSPRGSEGASR